MSTYDELVLKELKKIIERKAKGGFGTSAGAKKGAETRRRIQKEKEEAEIAKRLTQESQRIREQERKKLIEEAKIKDEERKKKIEAVKKSKDVILVLPEDDVNTLFLENERLEKLREEKRNEMVKNVEAVSNLTKKLQTLISTKPTTDEEKDLKDETVKKWTNTIRTRRTNLSSTLDAYNALNITLSYNDEILRNNQESLDKLKEIDEAVLRKEEQTKLEKEMEEKELEKLEMESLLEKKRLEIEEQVKQEKKMERKEKEEKKRKYQKSSEQKENLDKKLSSLKFRSY